MNRRQTFLQQFNLSRTSALQSKELVLKHDRTNCGINTVSAVSIAGDGKEFRRFQEELRNSKM
eukprot:14500729-Ditylum_brightwellii.AAC.1